MEKNNKKNENTKETRRRVILMVIALIIIILALITSCSCTSKFFGKIGSLFKNEENYLYTETEGNHCLEDSFCEIVLNRNLTFDNDKLNIAVDDDQPKLTFSYYGVSLKNFTCMTSDANIATCYVNKNGYVVINPKADGTVIVTLQSEQNDKLYQATATVTIGASKNDIVLQHYKGTINLYNTNKKTVVYRLINISGKVNVTSSNSSIATATAENGLLKITAYKPGKVTITLDVVYNGKTYKTTYELTVVKKDSETIPPINPSDKEKDALLSGLTTNKGPVSPTFNSKIKDYVINLGENVTDITVSATANSSKANIKYSYKNETNKTGYFDNLKEGKNIIYVTVTAEDGTENVYTLTVNVPKTGGSVDPDPLDNNSKLTSLTTDAGDLTPNFNPDVFGSINKPYTITIDSKDNDIKIIAKASETAKKVEFTYGNKTNETGYFDNLQDGNNFIIVTVTAEDGTQSKYVVNVVKPAKYELNFDSNLIECNYEDKTCRITYTFMKNGEDLTDIAKDIKLEIIGNFDGTYKQEPAIISLTPNTSYIQNDIKLKITYEAYNGKVTSETTVKFKTDTYYAKPSVKEYDAYVNTDRTININTNLFKNDSDAEKLNILKDMDILPNGKGFKLVSKHDKNLWLEISTNSSIIEKISIDKEAGLSSIIANIKANASGTAIINITGSAYGKSINDTIKINVYKQYKVTLSAGKGLFNPVTKEYEPFTISDKKEEDTIDLSKLDKPYLTIPDDECYSYKFIGFANSEDPTNKILYSIDGKDYPNVIKINEITKDIKLVAVYDSDPVNKEPLPPTTDVLWAVDVPLFYNKEYYDKYNIDKIIYPGAKGEYTLKLGNASDKKITVTGMILQEETICVDVTGDGKNDGCLNMAYQVKAAQNLDGVTTDVYKTLYKGSDTTDNKKLLYKYASLKEVDNGKNKDQDRRYINRDEWNFDLSGVNDEKIMSVEPGVAEEDGLHITILWEWIFDIDDFNDKIDTAIGNYSNEKSDSINDMYSLSVGLKLKIEDKTTCVYP